MGVRACVESARVRRNNRAGGCAPRFKGQEAVLGESIQSLPSLQSVHQPLHSLIQAFALDGGRLDDRPRPVFES
jgi:hypothetical protein